MRLLAVDQGSEKLGLAFFEGRELVDARLVRAPGRLPWGRRMRALAGSIGELARSSPEWIPDVVAIEDVVGHRGHPNIQGLITMAETRGYLTRVFDVLYPEARQMAISPGSRRAIVGGGRGRDELKKRARDVVRKMLRWELASEDENDACLVGLVALRDLDRERLGYRKPPRRRRLRQPRAAAAGPQLELGAHV